MALKLLRTLPLLLLVTCAREVDRYPSSAESTAEVSRTLLDDERPREPSEEAKAKAEEEATEAEGEEFEEDGGEEEGGEEEEEEFSNSDLKMGVMLLGATTFVMSLFYMVHHPDLDMKFYSWSVISDTVGIFVSVLSFTAVNELVDSMALYGKNHNVHVAFAVGQFLVYYLLLQVTMPILTGMCFCTNHGVIRIMIGMDTPKPAKSEGLINPEQWMCMEKDYVKARVKSFCTLLGHMTAFSAINVGGHLQHGKYFEENPWSTFLCPLVMMVVVGLLSRVSREYREAHLKEETEECAELHGGNRVFTEWAYEYWKEEAFATNNEVIALSASFVFVQALRFNLSGTLPNPMGVEEGDISHPQKVINNLGICALVFGIIAMVMVPVHHNFNHNFKEKKDDKDPWRQVLSRVIHIVGSFCGMSMAWCILYAVRWQEAWMPLGNPNFITARLCLALAISFITFFIIRCLDILADLDVSGPLVDEAIMKIIESLSLLVGFSWEQSFDVAVEILAEKTPSPVFIENGLAILVIIVVVPAWRWYIVTKVLALEHEREAKESDTTLLHKGYSAAGQDDDQSSLRQVSVSAERH